MTGRGTGPVPIPVPEGLVAWAARPGAQALLAAARVKLEAGRRGDSVRLDVSWSDAWRDDVSVLLGGAWLRSGRPVTLGLLRRSVTAQTGGDLVSLLEWTGGPLRDLPAERQAAAAAAAAAQDAARADLAGAGLAAEVAETLVPRPVPADRAGAVAAVWRALPDAGARVGLARLAADVFGDAHALDRDTALGRMLVRVLARVHGLDDEHVRTAAGWRAAWAAAGVDCDAVSATVLVLGVALDGDGPAALLSRAAAGEPVWLTARALAAGGWAWPAGARVRVCENPSVVEAAADRLGASCLPLVCTYGQPSTAAGLLLAGLGDGHDVAVSGDRDSTGAAITASLLAAVPGARAWLPDVDGVFEEERLDALLADLAR